MSSFEPASPYRIGRTIAASLLIAALAATTACTVRPLMADNTTTSGLPGGVKTDLSSIAIKPVQTRYAQEVRNQLIFLFNRGAGQPASPTYSMRLVVIPLVEQSVLVASGDDNEPTAGTITLIGNYEITDLGKGNLIASGKRHVMSAYDIPKQEFAATRALRDAENRAARELAQVLQLAIAQELATRQSGG